MMKAHVRDGITSSIVEQQIYNKFNKIKIQLNYYNREYLHFPVASA